jgi:hypothetical protein
VPNNFLSFSPKAISEFCQPYVDRTSSEANSDSPFICIIRTAGCLETANKVISGYINIVPGNHVVWAGGAAGNGSHLCDMPQAH